MYKLATPQISRLFTRSNVRRCTSARRGDVKTYLCDRKIPCSTYQAHDNSNVKASGRSLWSSSQEADFDRIWCENWKNLTLERFIHSVTVVTINSHKTTIVCSKQGSRNTGEVFFRLIETCQSHRKPCRYLKKRDIQWKSQGIRAVKRGALLKKEEESWPKPWFQANEAEAEQATGTDPEQLLNRRLNSSYFQIRIFNVYCMGFETKQKGPLKADEIHQAEQILFRFVQNESFPNVSKLITSNKEISNAPKRVLEHRIMESVSRIKSRCVKSRHRNANPIHPPMAELPRERFHEHVVLFMHFGV